MVTDESRWASSDRAQILFAENEFVLSGNPRVVQNESELRGTEIRLLNGGKDMRVIKANANLKNDPSALKGESRGAVK
jgi:lipopolysaccharide export system protein LptA